MKILEFFFKFLRYLSTPKEEYGLYSGGYWPAKIREETLKLCKNAEGLLLEAGCGEGLFLELVSKNTKRVHLIGIDKWLKALKEAKDRLQIYPIDLILADMRRPPFKRDCFDVIVCINTLFNLGSLEEVKDSLKELALLLNTKGKIIFEIKNALSPFIWLKYKFAKKYDPTLRVPLKAYHPKEIINFLKEIGLFLKRKIYFPTIGIFSPVIIIEAIKCSEEFP